MSLLTALSSGTTGLEASSLELSIVGDNIANSNTIGFKAGRAAFEDALTQSVIGGTGEIGLGARLKSVQKILTQGALTSTGIATDLALQGNGFFVVKGNYNGQTANFYSRAGQFTIDDNGYLVNLGGLRVQGFPADASGQVTGLPSDLLVGTASAQPNRTTEITFKANLNSDAAVQTWDPTDPEGTSSFNTTVSTYDSLGSEHKMQVFFTKTGTGTWDWHGMLDGSELTGGTAGTRQVVANGSLTFNTNGTLQTQTAASNFNPLNAVGPQPLTFDFGDDIASGGTGLLGVSQFASASSATYIGQDGYGSGQLSSVRIDAEGFVAGIFTNGQTRTLGQIAVASFSAPDQMERVGGNLMQQTQSSGQPVIGEPGSGGRASIISGSLEQSNVDLAQQFVRMIAAQRSFQANSKTITTADQLLTELINLRR
ncbi:MAG: flagellar hook protein FlgE [Anaeromyxobacter sp.]